MMNLRGLGGPLTKFVVFALITIFFTMVLAATIRNQVGGNLEPYHVEFVDATQVEIGDEIRIAGVRVGQVDEVSLVANEVALVTIGVQDSVRLPQGVEATIKIRNLTGQRYIALDPGTAAPGQFLESGATIPLAQTHPALNLTQLFNGFRPLLQALSPNDVNALSMNLVQVLQGEGATVTSLLAQTASLTSTLADKDRVIGDVIDNLNQVLDTVNARDDELTQLIITVRQLVSGLAADRNTIGEAISSIGELTDTTADLVKDARPPLKDDLRHLGDLGGNLNERRDLVEHFVTFLPEKLDRLIPLGTYASWFNFYFCDLQLKVSPGAPNIPVLANGAQRCSSGNDASFDFQGEGSGDNAFRSGGSEGSSPGSDGSVPALPMLGGGN